MTLELRIGDVFDRMAEIPDGSIDLIVTSPPFLALRSYLPSDHPDKSKEIGSEATPADFLDTLLELTAEFGRALAPHGSICVELGDTYAGSKLGGVGSYGQIQDGQQTAWKPNQYGSATITRGGGHQDKLGTGWPLAKSLTGIPTLYPWSLAYGRNLLTGQEHQAGRWRVRNLIVWARPNPPVGALGDKFRPATSYITVACRGPRRYFDLDAVRTEHKHWNGEGAEPGAARRAMALDKTNTVRSEVGLSSTVPSDGLSNPAGAPPLDWHADHHPEDGDWLWKLSTQPYAGSHYATFPMALPKRLIEAMCPLRVCVECGRPSERIVETTNSVGHAVGRTAWTRDSATTALMHTGPITMDANHHSVPDNAQRVTLGWSDCGHDHWRVGIVLDPFAGSGTTLDAAQAVGRHAIGIDLDARNAELARSRVGMFMSVDEGAA